MSYLALKHLHMGCVALSGSLFLLRGSWMWSGSPRLQQRWVRIAPHAVDTLLLISAVCLAVTSGQYPVAQNWLSAKLVGLLLYIVLGSYALKRGRTLATRRAFFVAALLVFVYIVAVAITKSPFVFA